MRGGEHGSTTATFSGMLAFAWIDVLRDKRHDTQMDGYCPGVKDVNIFQRSCWLLYATTARGIIVDTPISPGTKVFTIRDIVIGDQTAFRQGEQVLVEGISPNPQRPEYKYVILSTSLQKRYQLSDADIATTQPARSQPKVRQIRVGEKHVAMKDIVIDGETAFYKGNYMFVEQVEPDPLRPEKKYVVYSDRLKKQVRLSGKEIRRYVDSPWAH